jgi:UDP-N-acetylmuramate dehydrogenase
MIGNSKLSVLFLFPFLQYRCFPIIPEKIVTIYSIKILILWQFLCKSGKFSSARITCLPGRFKRKIESVMDKLSKFLQRFQIPYRKNALLAEYTTIGIGGPAEWLIIVDNPTQLAQTVTTCMSENIPWRILGNGSNLIISDSGVAGAVILNRCSDFQILNEQLLLPLPQKIPPRLHQLHPPTDVFQEGTPLLVRVAAGAKIIPLMKLLYRQGIVGLEWFAGIPATVGGAVYMNMHGAHQYFGELVYRAKVLLQHGIETVPNSWFEFDYDWCRLHREQGVVLEVDLLLRKGNPTQAQQAARAWARAKSLQPQKSAGCIFQNLTSEQQQRANLPSPSVGYLIDKILALKGVQKGGAQISPRHAAFIENTGNASAADVAYLIELIANSAAQQLNISLIPEIIFWGNFENFPQITAWQQTMTTSRQH